MITFMESFVKELEHESVGTRKMLALVPADKSDWKPHEKSMKLKDLATHIADLPSWITMAIDKDELDFATAPYNPEDCNGGEELVRYFDKNLEEAKRHLTSNSDSVLEKTWTLRNGEIIYMQSNKLVTIRHSYCQLVHHRAQLGVYLRLLNIPIPGVYGPSADEQTM
ncbi:MAG TPA: DinB family protein [Bacteroidia bacterium]|nr:DinB family protein [Bacteroidia bacterium]